MKNIISRKIYLEYLVNRQLQNTGSANQTKNESNLCCPKEENGIKKNIEKQSKVLV